MPKITEKKDVTKYRAMESDSRLHERHRKVLKQVNDILEGIRQVVVGNALERIASAVVVGLFSLGDSSPGFVKKIKKQVRGEIVIEQIRVEPSKLAGHILLKGPPGGGKTLMGKTLASLTDLLFGRIQMTPDKTPRDITVRRVQEGEEVFTYYGPIFSNILLADEINRATPKTQSALLEAMSEGAVTYEEAGNTITRQLDNPFHVTGTLNPVEKGEGTYNLPAAQLDRFMFQILFELPDAETIDAVLELTEAHEKMVIGPVTDLASVLDARDFIRNEIEVPKNVKRYIRRLIMATYDPFTFKEIFPELKEKLGGQPLVLLPPNSRAAMHLQNAAKTIACFSGERVVDSYHVQKRFFEIVNHRFILNDNLRPLYDEFGGPEGFIKALITGDRVTGRKGLLQVVPVDE